LEEILSGEVQRAFAFVRPPGHHAEPGRAMGFCLFNNVAIAAAYAHVTYRVERIAIVDIDVHHGNGTQASFYDTPHLLYISSHQYPFYPGTGNFDEIGSGEGKGYTLNFPLPAGTGDETFVPLYSRIVAKVLEQYRPQCVLVSAGFDAHIQDALGGLCVTTAGYASAAASLVRAADQCCQGRILFVLEGGYSKEALQSCTKAVMAEMESDSPSELPLPGDELFQEISEHAKKFVGDFWKW
jgi:acetoin utilization deacetylase AcuC-like enzyme